MLLCVGDRVSSRARATLCPPHQLDCWRTLPIKFYWRTLDACSLSGANKLARKFRVHTEATPLPPGFRPPSAGLRGLAQVHLCVCVANACSKEVSLNQLKPLVDDNKVCLAVISRGVGRDITPHARRSAAAP